MVLKLALHGPLKSGKSTLGHALEERGFQFLDYTGLLKRYLSEALAAIGIDLPVEEILANKEKYRLLLIEFGAAIGFDDGFGVDRMLAEIKPDATGVVFDNVRFYPQWDKLQDAGFTLLRLTTPEKVRLARARGAGIHRDRFYAIGIEEPSEQPLAAQHGEIHLSVNGDIEKVIERLTNILFYRALPA